MSLGVLRKERIVRQVRLRNLSYIILWGALIAEALGFWGRVFLEPPFFGPFFVTLAVVGLWKWWEKPDFTSTVKVKAVSDHGQSAT